MLLIERHADKCVRSALRCREQVSCGSTVHALCLRIPTARQSHDFAKLRILRVPDNPRKSSGRGRTFNRSGRPEYSSIVAECLKKLLQELEDAPLVRRMWTGHGQGDGRDTDGFKSLWAQLVRNATSHTTSSGSEPVIYDKKVRHDLVSTFQKLGDRGLLVRLRYHFYHLALDSESDSHLAKRQQFIADSLSPTEMYPATRVLRRKIHLHIGPTNSGKTYHALQRLEQAAKGIYAGPLRLLAHEVYSRFNAKNIPCGLITGEERRLPPETVSPPTMENQIGQKESKEGRMIACTVETLPLNRAFDVAVIDEIQMIGSPERGWAWTQALLGVQAPEIHLCGEARTAPLIQQLCASVGDEVEIHEYERLSPLHTANESLRGDLKNLRKGDCVICFSIMGIHAMRKQIERATGRKVAVVYGSLPPETRAQQARLFNEPDNEYDYLVASDAVGMGLNLAIKRIVFESVTKFDGYKHGVVPAPDMKQIGGRAGRFRVSGQAESGPATAEELTARADGSSGTNGLVTTLEQFDLKILQDAMASDPPPLTSAGILPPTHVMEQFAAYFPEHTPFSYLMIRFAEICKLTSRFHLCSLKDVLAKADLLETVRNIPLGRRAVLCAAPGNTRDPIIRELMIRYAKCIAEQSGGSLLDMPEMPLGLLEQEPADGNRKKAHLRDLESMHMGLCCYLWLSYRFTGVFTTRDLAFRVKTLVESKIEKTLVELSFEDKRRAQAAIRRKLLQEAGLIEDDGDTEPVPDVTIRKHLSYDTHSRSATSANSSFAFGLADLGRPT